jgi:transcriptional regulator with XRE-family HTH domain
MPIKKLNKDKEAGKLAQNIKKFMKRINFSAYKLAKEARLSNSTVNEFLKGQTKNIEWVSLYQIAIALETTIDSLITGTKVEIIDNPEHRAILKSMPPEAKLFFRSTKGIPKENVKIILDLIKLSIKEIDRPPNKMTKGKK